MKKKKRLILSCLLAFLCTGMAQAEDVIYATTTVQQNGTTVEADDTAHFDIGTNAATMEFVTDASGNVSATMTINNVIVAQIPIDANGGGLVGAPGSAAEIPASTQSITLSAKGYATLYSPFRVVVPTAESGVEVYAPTYSGGLVHLNGTTKITPENTVPVNQVLVIKGTANTSYNFSFTQEKGTETSLTAADGFGGSVLSLATLPTVASGNALYTMGVSKDDDSKYGFFKYGGTTLSPRKAYLIAPVTSEAKQGFEFSLDDATAIETVEPEPTPSRVMGNGVAYNLAGQRVSANTKGIVIINGKKIFNK